LLSGEEVETSLQFANAVAALKCRDLGARTALPDRNALTEFMDTFQRQGQD
jgi:sugar/nucleoside kinase (ribokinase family)